MFGHNTDKKRFERLFTEYYAPLYRYAFLLIGQSEASKDIVSDVFEEVWKRFSELKAETQSAFLYTAVRNRCLNYLQHQNVTQQYAEFVHRVTRYDVEGHYAEHEALLQQVEKLSDALPEQTRFILRECYYHHKKYQQVADELGITSSAVKKHIMKALRLLREGIKKKP